MMSEWIWKTENVSFAGMHDWQQSTILLFCGLIGCFLIIPLTVSASDWRMYLGICNQDPVCAKEQAAARDIWDNQNWSTDLKATCRKQYIQVYAKDYRAAVTCVSELEKQRQEFELRQADIDRKRNEHKTYRTWGGIIVK